ncbi:MAG: VWA domain-containing protein [Gemmatimonadaceae bacterium]
MIPYFDRPLLLILAPLLALGVATLLVLAFRKRRQRLARLGTSSVVERLVPPTTMRTPWIRVTILAAAVILAGIALAGPRWGVEAAIVRGSGADIVLALDASLSMLGTDERPNRLQRMKQEARRLLAASDGDRFGLIAFAGRSYILTPLTVDRGAMELFLDNLDPSVVGQAGSSLARTIRQGTDLLASTNTGADRALVVMSDGESFEPEDEIVASARRAAEAGITLITVGFGTTGGSTIPVRTPQGTVSKKDDAGEVVITRYHPEMLSAAAQGASGLFIEAGATDKAARIRQALTSLRRSEGRAERGRDRRPQFQLFLLPAVLLALIDTLISERRGRRKRAPAAAATAAAVILLLVLPRAALADEGGEGDRLFRAGRFEEAAAAYQRAVSSGSESPRLLYNLGTALLAAGRGDDAVAPLQRAAESRDLALRYRALFNLGLIYLRRGLGARDEAAEQAFSAALEAYKRALRLRPAEHDAKWNYELANRKRKQSGGGGGGGGGEQKESPSAQEPTPRSQQPRPGSLSEEQAEQILNSAAREERDVQGKKQRQNQPERPPGGKDW